MTTTPSSTTPSTTAEQPATTAPRQALVYRPDSAVFWVFVAALLLGSVGTALVLGRAFLESIDTELRLAPLWLAAFAVLVWIIGKFDPFRATRPYRQALFAATALGGTAAMSMVYGANLTYDDVLLRIVSPQTLTDWSSALRAPVIEEAAKGMCAALILVLCATALHRVSHALLVGMFVGLGFEIIEDLHFAGQAAIAGLDGDAAGISNTVIVRFAAALPSHWSYTGLTAVAVLLLLPTFSERARWGWGRRLGVAAALLVTAWFLHFWFDMPLYPLTVTGMYLYLAKFPVCLVLFLAIAWWLIRDERAVVEERIAAGRARGALADVDEEVLDSLPTLRRRRALRKQAKRAGGRAAKRAVRAAQARALDLIQAMDAPQAASGE